MPPEDRRRSRHQRERGRHRQAVSVVLQQCFQRYCKRTFTFCRDLIILKLQSGWRIQIEDKPVFFKQKRLDPKERVSSLFPLDARARCDVSFAAAAVVAAQIKVIILKASTQHHGVIAAPGVDVVIARAAADPVIPVAGLDAVIATAGRNLIAAVPGFGAVGAVLGFNCILPVSSLDLVVPPSDVIVLLPSPSWIASLPAPV
nr:hypothetical protein [Leisingera sp. F5]